MRIHGALLVVGLTLVASLTACSGDGSSSSAPSPAASPVASATAVALLARDCPPDTLKTSTLGETIVAGEPASVTYCGVSTGNPAAPPKGVALQPARTFALLTNTEAHPAYQPPFCSAGASIGTAGLLLTYPNDATHYVTLVPGDCASLTPSEGDDGYYLLTDDIEWLAKAAGVDWLGKDGVRESTPPVPALCPTSAPKARPLAPVLAKGEPYEAMGCRYEFDEVTTLRHGVIETILDPEKTFRKLTAASRTTPNPDQACTAEADPPSAIALSYRDGTRATVLISTSGCWTIVQKEGALPSAPADERPIDIPDDSILSN